MYADDIVLMAMSVHDLQPLLNTLYDRCSTINNKRVALWSMALAGNRCKKWFFYLWRKIHETGMLNSMEAIR